MRFFGLTALLIGGVMLLPAGAQAYDSLNLRVRANDRVLELSNPNGFDLGDCYIAVNSRYKAMNVAIARGQSSEVWLSELMTSNDVRFDARLERLKRVYVACRKPTTADASFEIQ
jgi:hypothetical protein